MRVHVPTVWYLNPHVSYLSYGQPNHLLRCQHNETTVVMLFLELDFSFFQIFGSKPFVFTSFIHYTYFQAVSLLRSPPLRDSYRNVSEQDHRPAGLLRKTQLSHLYRKALCNLLTYVVILEDYSASSFPVRRCMMHIEQVPPTSILSISALCNSPSIIRVSWMSHSIHPLM